MDTIIRKYIDKVTEIYEGVCDDPTPGATDCLECFQKQFFGNHKICYDCDPKTQIYIGRYFPVHVKENLEALKLLPTRFIQKLFRRDMINIMNIGGGPGCDSYAIKKFLTNLEKHDQITSHKNIYILRIDREENWNNIAAHINEKIPNTKYLTFDARRKIFDVAKDEWIHSRNRKYNIFTMSYFLSELDDVHINIIAKFIDSFASKEISAVIINDNNRFKVHNLQRILFQRLQSKMNYEAENDSKYHCDFSYADDDRDFIRPKLYTNSIRYIKILYYDY